MPAWACLALGWHFYGVCGTHIRLSPEFPLEFPQNFLLDPFQILSGTQFESHRLHAWSCGLVVLCL